MRQPLTTKRPAAKVRFATLKRIAEDTPEDVMEALEGIKKHYEDQMGKVEALIENLSDEPTEDEGKKEASAKKFATLRAIAQDTPEGIAEAIQELYDGVDDSAEFIEILADNLDVKLEDEDEDKGEPKEASAPDFSILLQGEPEPFEIEDKQEQGVVDLPEVYEDMESGKTLIEPKQSSYFVLKATHTKTGKTAYFNGNDFTSKFNTGGKQFANVETAKMAAKRVAAPKGHKLSLARVQKTAAGFKYITYALTDRDLERRKAESDFRPVGMTAIVETNKSKITLKALEAAQQSGWAKYVAVATYNMDTDKEVDFKKLPAKTASKKASTAAELDDFTRHYLVTALWSSSDNFEPNGGDPLDSHFGIEDLEQEVIDKAVQDCASFREQAGSLLDAYEDSTAGHDFWLTRNHEGAGFWDGDYEAAEGDGDALTEIAQTFPSVDLYIVVYDEMGNQVPYGEEEGAEDAETLRAKLDSGEYTAKIYCQ